MEEQWFTKSTGKMNYITIDESQLNIILQNKSLENAKKTLDNLNFKI